MKKLLPALWFLVTCTVLLSAGWILVLSGSIRDLERVERLQRELLSTYEVKRRHAVNYDAYRRQLVDLEELLSGLVKALPDRIKDSEVHGKMTRAAQASGVEIDRFELERENKKGFYAENLFSIQIDADFPSIISFVGNLGSMPALNKVESLKIRRYGDNLRAQLEIAFYRYLSEDEQ